MRQLDLSRAIVLTVAYSGVFSFPLTIKEVWQRLLGHHLMTELELYRRLRQLQARGWVSIKDGYVLLTSLKTPVNRWRRLEATDRKLTEAQSFLRLVRMMPGVQAVAVSGSVAVGNAKDNDDVDWLIVTSPQSLWLVRPMVLFVAGLFGKRRGRKGDHRDNSWCFNMFLTETTLQVPPENRSVYTAYEVCQVKFLFDRGGIERLFLRHNVWVKSILPNFFASRIRTVVENSAAASELKWDDGGWGWLNWLSFKIQYWYMRPHMTREVVGLNLALFHPRNTKKSIYSRWKKIVRQIK